MRFLDPAKEDAMATAQVEILVSPTAGGAGASGAADPFRYGWRFVRREQPEGGMALDQVPLTLDDVVHPQEEDFIVHSEAHQRRCVYLYNALSAQLAADPGAVVLHDVRVAWDIPELRAHGPDIAVILGVRERKNWSTFDVAEEGVRPALIVEVTSPETAPVDRSLKVDEYDMAGVPLYVLVDTVLSRAEPRLRLVGYAQSPNGYQVLAPNERGWLWLAPARTWLGIADNELVCYDEAGRPLGDYRAVAAALATAEQRAEAAEARLRELEAELGRRERPAG